MTTGFAHMDEMVGDTITRSEDYIIMRDIIISFEEDMDKDDDSAAILFARTGIPGEMLLKQIKDDAEKLTQAIDMVPALPIFEDNDQKRLVVFMTAFIHGMTQGRAMKHGSTLLDKLKEAAERGDDPTSVATANIDKEAVENISKLTAVKQVALMGIHHVDSLKFPMLAQVLVGFLVGWEFDSLRRTRRVFEEAADGNQG
jgi:hypothetical protein